MRPTARSLFRQFSEQLEGRRRNPYADVKGFVTVSVGCILEPIDLALGLDWRVGDRKATAEEIRNDWHAVKALKGQVEDLRRWTAERQAPLTSIRLTDEGVDALLEQRLQANVTYLRNRLFPRWDEFSADAQLGIMSTAWALGAGFDHLNPPRHALIAAVNAGDWISAKVHAHLREIGNAGVVDRNRQQEICFDNAANVAARGLDPALLWWPRRCPQESTLKEEAVKAIGLIDETHDTDPAPAPESERS